MDRLTGMDANGDIISTEEYTIIASKRITNEEKRSIENHILEKLYKYENMEEELKSLANLYEKTFDWGCNDEATDLFAHAVYAVISENKIFRNYINEFKNYMLENLK